MSRVPKLEKKHSLEPLRFRCPSTKSTKTSAPGGHPKTSLHPKRQIDGTKSESAQLSVA